MAQNSDHINAKITYAMWREEHLWNASVLQEYIFTILFFLLFFIFFNPFYLFIFS
jgi:hypothetical protein